MNKVQSTFGTVVGAYRRLNKSQKRALRRGTMAAGIAFLGVAGAMPRGAQPSAPADVKMTDMLLAPVQTAENSNYVLVALRPGYKF